MQYYSEEKMHTLREQLEKEVLRWPDVHTKKMYGCPCYKHGEKLFAFLVIDGVVLIKMTEQDKMKATKDFEVKPFQAGAKRIMYRWPQIRVQTTVELEKILPFIKKSYSLCVE
jgi:predicted DNA-binding protein (MmcQ/YjbR family)